MAHLLHSLISKNATIFCRIPSPIFTFAFVILLCIMGFYSLHHPPILTQTKTQSHYSSPSFHQIFLSLSSNSTLSHYLRFLTLHPHLAGTDQARHTAKYVRTHFQDLGLETRVAEYQGEEKMATIQDVFAIIRGSEEPDRYVLLGNHRDAWTYGAVDPNSGTAALFDIARRYAALLNMGWRPRRTLVLCSWDAEEFGMIGSTEWVEQNLILLGSKAVAYLNVDCAVQGPGLFAGASPQLDDILVEVMKKVKDPDVDGTMVYEQWTAANEGINIRRLSGVDSDFAPFLHHAGVPSVDMYYGKDFPVYHTAFDSYEWMVAHGDPFFHRHVAVSGVWGLLALHLADDPILPFNYLSYAAQLQEHISALSGLLEGNNVSLGPLYTSLGQLFSAAREIEVEKLRVNGSSSALMVMKRRMLNDRLMLAERGLLDTDGLHSMRWFKHLVYGPCREYESKLSVLPGIADAAYRSMQMGKEEREAIIQHEIWRVARAIQRAADALRGQLI